ncbi:MAG: four helix bundle protein [Verrucomicrobiae bacterium]|nr:four helix bundle protein [Verrucomicrobiae bacterium]
MSAEQKVTQGYRELISWQKAMLLTKLVYQLTAKFPAEEKFGLIAQMRRAAVSIPSNLAEGQARRTAGEFVQFISHAEGSTAELDTQVTLSIELGFCSISEAGEVHGLIQELRKMLNALRRSVSHS